MLRYSVAVQSEIHHWRYFNIDFDRASSYSTNVRWEIVIFGLFLLFKKMEVGYHLSRISESGPLSKPKTVKRHGITSAKSPMIQPNQAFNTKYCNCKPSGPCIYQEWQNTRKKEATKNRNTIFQIQHKQTQIFTVWRISLHELNEAIKTLVNGKASGIDDINTELFKQLGPNCWKWLLKLFHACIRENNISKVWRKPKTIAILKPGKNPKIFDQFHCYFTPTSSWNKWSLIASCLSLMKN